jgi:ABC-type ATPase with predicted acetyltransferase domain
MSSILSLIEEEQINAVRLVRCPKCGRIVKANNECECDIFFQGFRKK